MQTVKYFRYDNLVYRSCQTNSRNFVSLLLYLASGLENFVKKTDGRWLVGDPVEAGEGGDQGEGGQVGGGEGFCLTDI